MANLTITELHEIGFDAAGNSVASPGVPGLADYSVAIGGAAASPAAPNATFGNGCRYIMINCDVACCLAFGPNPTAVAGIHRMGGNETRFYKVSPGHAISVIASPT